MSTNNSGEISEITLELIFSVLEEVRECPQRIVVLEARVKEIEQKLKNDKADMQSE